MTIEQRMSVLMAYHKQPVKTKNFTCKIIGFDIEHNDLVLRANDAVISDAFVHPVSGVTLPLRSIEQMTADEYAEMGKLLFGNFHDGTLVNGYPKGGSWESAGRAYIAEFCDLNEWQAVRRHEYLISIGIAVPMYGLSVQDMIDAGLVTIKTEK